MQASAAPTYFPFAGVALLLALLVPLAADAKPSFSLKWTAPPGCPSSSDVAQQVSDLLGPSPRQAPNVEVSAVVRRTVSGWHLELRTRQGSTPGSREMDGDSCEALAEATALIVAMMVDPDAVAARKNVPQEPPAPSDQSAATPSAGPPHPTTSSPPRLVPPAPPPTSTPTDKTTIQLALGPVLGLEVGPLPSPGLVDGIQTGLIIPRWRFDALVLWRSDQDSDSTSPSVGGRVSLTTASLTACRQNDWKRLQYGPCIGFDAGRISAEGYGIADTTKSSLAWWGALAAIHGSFSLDSWIALRTDAIVLFPFVRPKYRIDPLGSVHQPAPLGLRLQFGLEVRIP